MVRTPLWKAIVCILKEFALTYRSVYPAAGKWIVGENRPRETREVWNETIPKWKNAKFFGTLKPNLTKDKVKELLKPHKCGPNIERTLTMNREQLQKYPLYITLDKDCIIAEENPQNWNCGLLTRNEVRSSHMNRY